MPVQVYDNIMYSMHFKKRDGGGGVGGWGGVESSILDRCVGLISYM